MIAVSDGLSSFRKTSSTFDTIQVGDPLRVGNERMLSITVDANLARGGSVARDTVMAVGLFDQHASSVIHVATLAQWIVPVGGFFNPLAVGALTWAGDSGAFYVSEGNRALFRMDLRPGHYRRCRCNQPGHCSNSSSRNS